MTLHRICHDKIHAVFSDAELWGIGGDIARIRAHPDIAAFVRWIARKPAEFVDGHHTERSRKK